MEKKLQNANLTEEEIQAKMKDIENNFACIPGMLNGVGFCAKSFDENGKMITSEENQLDTKTNENQKTEK